MKARAGQVAAAARASGSTRSWMVSLLALGALAVVLSLGRLVIAGPGVTGDTFWYARQMAILSGHSDAAANEIGGQLLAEVRGDNPAVWAEVAASVDKRYPAIFAARPLYPMAAAAFEPILGTGGLLIISIIAGAACAGAVATAGRVLSGSDTVGISSGIFTLVLPSGQWFTYLLADGLMLALWAVALVTATQFSRDGRWTSLAAFAFAVLGLWLAKSANGGVMVVVIGGSTLVLGLTTNSTGRFFRLLAVSIVAGAVYLGLASVFGFSGVIESLQDLSTRHFAAPDVANPITDLLARNSYLLASLPSMLATGVVPVLLLGGGLLALMVCTRSPDRYAWLVASACCAGLVIAHPLPSEIPRLVAPAWLSAAIGLGWGSMLAATRIPSLWIRFWNRVRLGT